MASGESLGVWDALSSRSPGGGAPSFFQFNAEPALLFAETLDKTTYFYGLLPTNYSGGDIEIHLFWNTSNNTANDIKIDAAFERRQPGVYNIDDGDSFGTASTVILTVADDNLLHEDTVTITAANAGTPVAGEPFRFSISRNGSDVADTFLHQWLLFAVALFEA